MGHSRPGRANGKSGHVRYAESGNKFKGISGSAIGHGGLMALPET
jgi:hypothetical protein